MKQIRKHRLTGQTLLLKKYGSNVSSYYLLDENKNKIKDGLNIMKKQHYKVVVCLNKNMLWKKKKISSE